MQRRAIVGGIAALLILVVVGVVAWHWLSHPPTPVSADMRAAAAQLLASRGPIPPAPVAPAHPQTDRERLIAAAFALRGVPYRFGAKGPDAFDCSGFTRAAYAQVGISLPDGSYNQARGEKPLSDPGTLVAGDLILYRWAGGAGVTHVTMYAGGGWVIGTGSPGQPAEVTLYPLADDLVNDGRVLSYRHIALPGER